MVHVEQKKETGLGQHEVIKDDRIFFWWTIPLREHYAVSSKAVKSQKNVEN